MQFTQTAFAAILAIASSAAASPLAARQATLQDFQVNKVTSYSPSGRPGSYPWAQITASVTDPNEINLGTSQSDGSNVTVPAGSQGLDCKAQWYTKGESPLDRTWPCDATSNGYWIMNVLAGSSGFATGDFNLKFTHVADLVYRGEQFTESFEAEGHFAVGENLSGSCGGSGICTWGLKSANTPFEIAVTKV
ncbi:hypothetical protein AA0120_g11659 [Alternaria tenuissima]|nr:hypothetical protein AA0120_g11659 [Alternaria tenuissima]RYO54785.1 hypothetical protein AA0116_g9255 [Alternaria tenuissima]